jgi:hypothetical protein
MEELMGQRAASERFCPRDRDAKDELSLSLLQARLIDEDADQDCRRHVACQLRRCDQLSLLLRDCV